MKLRAGVVGLGILGRQHVAFLNNQPEVDVVAVADILSDRAQEIGAQVAQAVGQRTNDAERDFGRDYLTDPLLLSNQ